MLEHDVPQWYICSCEKIDYLLPKADEVFNIMMELRIAYYKVFYPLAFYAAYFTFHARNFSCDEMFRGKENLEHHMNNLECRLDNLREARFARSISEEEDLFDMYDDMRIAQEMYARGYEFVPVDPLAAKEREFQIIDGKLMPPLNDGRREDDDEGI